MVWKGEGRGSYAAAYKEVEHGHLAQRAGQSESELLLLIRVCGERSASQDAENGRK